MPIPSTQHYKVSLPGNDREMEIEEALLLVADGYLSLERLPLTDAACWQAVIEIASRRRMGLRKRPDAVSMSQRLLSQHLSGEAETARHVAAGDSLQAGEVRVRRWAVWALRDAGESALDDLVNAARDKDDDVRLQAVRILATSKAPKALAALARVVEFSHALPGTVAAEALVSWGTPATPALAKILDSEDDLARWRAVDCLARIHSKNCLGPLLGALHDSSADIAWRAADGLIAMGEAIGVDVLRDVLGKPQTRSTIVGLRHYAEHAQPRSVFAPVVEATAGLVSGSATPLALTKALENLRASRKSEARRGRNQS